MLNRESGSRTGVRSVLLAAAAAAALTGALTGCSGSGSGSSGSAVSSADQAVNSSDALSSDPLTAVRSAADITGRSGYVQDATALTTVSGAKRMTLHGTAQYDYTTRLGRMAITIPPGEGTTGKLTEVFAPGVVYMQNSGAKVPAGKWIEVNLQELADGNLVSSGATDPASAANALRGAQTAVAAGTQTVDGVVLKHYTGTLDLAQAAAETGGGAGTGLTLAARTFTVKKVPYQLWLDQRGQIRKIVETFTFSKVPGSTAAKDQEVVVSTSEFSDYGTPVTISLPPSADIYGGQSTAK
ncbi:hypothetical protein GXW83_32015 [Streptacidiphilus sp. PB12-B1b]|uniref:hypothetical protein n=1 Tax=Streptacidiphilus sp. PB12-B1b TaxID=2705012 RepID=UPI0015FBF9E4|nr:hypothetical protein [Streptacidiphilus sp. PB12-B1b]QMU79646.1 hypothetical protein GXW83_32015 [Streptacidiphilus sp. PB12-B1b]